jgi:predicted CXXCH cytochrome family protein
MADYPVKFTFGWKPLQQYLLQLPGGHLQAFSVAWDTRAASEGGQRWFHLYPGENIDFRDPLHWTGPYQNWNFMCSDCHSTNVRHNYDAATDRFDTQWSAPQVSCEACHGPGSAHIGWAERQRHFWTRWRNEEEDRGLVVRFEHTASPEHRAAILRRSTLSFAESAELKACAVCHSRRTPLTNEFLPAEGYDQHYLAALLSDDLYFVDGQIKDEVYEYNSFRQSKMFAKGVNCSDCHDPHSAQLRSDRQGVCLQCHAADRYDVATHHHHPETDRKAAVGCVDCHMPQRSYMVVDPRRDHSFRVPRPELSERYGVPNACQQCHREKSAAWTAVQVKHWLGRDASGFQQFSDTLHAVRRTMIGAETLLRGALDSATTPPVAKGSILADAGPLLHAIPDALGRSLRSPFVAERLGALRATESLPPASRWRLAGHLLADSERAIRIEAARLLARSDLTAEQRRRLDGPLHELQNATSVYASRPQWRMIAASVAAALGHPEQAIEQFEAALSIQPGFSQAYANLADLYRGLGQEDKVREVLARGLRAAPDDAALHYAQGLHLVRIGRLPDGLKAIKRAVDLAPEDSGFAYGYAVGLYSIENKKPAFDFLSGRLKRFPTERNALYLLTQMAVQERRLDALRPYRYTLEQLAGEDPVARQLLQALPP